MRFFNVKLCGNIYHFRKLSVAGSVMSRYDTKGLAVDARKITFFLTKKFGNIMDGNPR